MKLILQNGYPYPYPKHLTQQQEDDLADAAAGNRLEIAGVVCLQWLHSITVQFDPVGSAWTDAKNATGWEVESAFVLEAKTSTEDGYDHPAIVVRNMAYCGFMLVAD
jgi:hypothetical protein